MPAYTQTWFVPGMPPQVSAVELEPVHGTYAPAYSFAYFCPRRIEVWARRVVMDENGKTNKAIVTTVLHPDEHDENVSYWPSGLLLVATVPERSWVNLPPAILAREFLILMAWAEKYLTDG